MKSPFQAAERFAGLILTHKYLCLAFWLLTATVCYLAAPRWHSIALDGDFDHLPAGLASVEGKQLLDAAFPVKRARSQLAIVVGRWTEPLDDRDRLVSIDLSRRIHHAIGESRMQAALAAGWKPGTPSSPETQTFLEEALESLNIAVALDTQWFNALEKVESELTTVLPRLAIAYADRAVVHRSLGSIEKAEIDEDAVAKLAKEELASIDQRPKNPLGEIVSALVPEDAVIGHRLRRPRVQLILLRLQTELAEFRNIALLQGIHQLADRVQQTSGKLARAGLAVEVTGSAAVGAEALTAARDAIRYTEIFTVVLVLAILAVVYQAPLLVGVPIVSIAISVVVATGIIAWMVLGGRELGIPHPEVFTTSHVFVVVICFGAGTDFCLFLISRLREECRLTNWNDAVSASLSKTLGAIVGSALTTIVGLGTMVLATFGKFHHTGPVIAICLLITLATCVTLTPVILRMMGPKVFWPKQAFIPDGRLDRVWVVIARAVTGQPGWVLSLGLILLMIPAIYGWRRQDSVTYDFVSQLSASAPARVGANLLASEFPAGETNPISVVIYRDSPLEKTELEDAVKHLAEKLYVPGVGAVRSLQNPLGDPPGVRTGLLDANAWRRRAVQSHPVSRAYFISEVPEYQGRLARFDVVPEGDPFGAQAAMTLDRVMKMLEEQTHHPGSPWYKAKYAVAGTTASIQDLRTVTIRDTKEIQISVVIAVLLVLFLVVRRVLLSVYLVVTVLISYFATLGITILFFRWIDGSAFVGLDWKLPLFLFVILVAVGQDYNVYLVTRVMEEANPKNFRAGLRRAVSRTGGIITSCGVVMAGTFFTMTSAAWVPQILEWIGIASPQARPLTLASNTQLGFALCVGVLLDTFYVRPILVPAFMAIFPRLAGRFAVRSTTRRMRSSRIAIPKEVSPLHESGV